jgi:PPOX class probable F420-dependent enzyme
MTRSTLSTAALQRAMASAVVWLTTLRSDGSPHTTPVWFVLDGAVLSVVTGESNAKTRNLRGDPRVSVAFEGSTGSPLVAEGMAEVVEMAGVSDELARAFALKYNGWDIRDGTVDGPRIVAKVRVVRWLMGS